MTSVVRVNEHSSSTRQPVAQVTNGEQRPRQSFAPIFVMCCFVMSLFFIVGNLVVMWVWFDDPATGIGVGVMSAVWGGPGFGVMAAGAIWSGDATPTEQRS